MAAPLQLPAALCNGYVATVLILDLGNAGVGTAAIGGFLFVTAIPLMGRILYAPLLDTTLGVRRWYAIGATACAAGLAAMAFTPPTQATLALLTFLAFLTTVAVTLVGTPTESILAQDVAPEHKGKTSAWKMATALGVEGLGSGLAIWMVAKGAPHWAPPLVLAALCLLCIPFSWAASPRKPLAPGAGVRREAAAVASRLWDLLRSRGGLLVLLLAALPICTGALALLTPVLAKDWRAGAAEVAAVAGVPGGVLVIAGAFAGGWICDRWNRRWTYCAAGAATALTVVVMVLGPRTPAAFVSLNLLYLFFVGVGYTGLQAAVLDVIGEEATASKFALLTTVQAIGANGGVMLEGWVNQHFKLNTMLFMEAGAALVSILIYALATVLLGRPGGKSPGGSGRRLTAAPA